MITVKFQIRGEENDYSVNKDSTVFYSFGGELESLPYTIYKNKFQGWDRVGGRREIQEREDICIPVADSCC